MREVVLDTETTGLSFKEGHKIVEIACLETNDLIPTGKKFHKVINPNRDVPEEAFRIHGYSSEFLKDNKIKNIKLPVSAPFHCSLMSKATMVMTEELQKINFEQ